ncbi:MAG: hypothetical protein AWL62_1824 [Halanaerobium sp. T82-1]|nr:MAG: hypothetical protein AWL62_1824 [Halanaerobium sp. T82-1]
MGLVFVMEQIHSERLLMLHEMIADGTAAEISEKWFGEDIVLK